MKIASSAMDMAAASQAQESVTVQRLQVTTIVDGVRAGGMEAPAANSGSVLVDLSDTAKQLVEDSNARAANTLANVGSVGASRNDLYEPEDYRITLLRRMLELLTGKKVDNRIFRRLRLDGSPPKTGPQPMRGFSAEDFRKATLIGQRTISTVSFTSVEVRTSEKVSFQAQGTVTTEDGRTIDMSVALNMSQELYAKFENTTVSQTQINLYDPLVVNFGAATAGVSGQKFEFDLDSDGTADQVSRLLAGSGFLCLDKNGDGAINNGGELFGAKSGDGFKDLAAYDKDGNGWIDENDDIFNKLQIWVKDENGKDTLFSLGELGIGAVYLGSVGTQYSYNASGGLDGMLRSTGVFLREDGSAGTVQHVDLSL